MPDLRIEVVKTDDIVPYSGNAKLHPDEQIEQIVESIKSFGNNDPIAVWHNDSGEMEVIEGHGRLLAMKRLGIEEVPVIFLDHLSDKQRRAYTHIHNQLTMNTGFDIEILKSELERLEGFFDIDLYGFDVGEEFSSEDWIPEEAEEEQPEEPQCDQSDKFNCLFVYHGEEDERRLMEILGVDELELVYEMEDLICE